MLLSSLFTLLSCVPANTDVICDTMARISVNVKIVDPDGVTWPMDGTYLWYSVDGSEEVPAETHSDTWLAGVELPGEYTLRAGVDYWVHETDCTGYLYGQATEVVTVGMTEDGCHVEPVNVDIVIEPDCITATVGTK